MLSKRGFISVLLIATMLAGLGAIQGALSFFSWTISFLLIFCAHRGSLQQGILVLGASIAGFLAVYLSSRGAGDAGFFALWMFMVPIVFSYSIARICFHEPEPLRITLVTYMVGFCTLSYWVVMQQTSGVGNFIDTLFGVMQERIRLEVGGVAPENFEATYVMVIKRIFPSLMAICGTFFSSVLYLTGYRFFLKRRGQPSQPRIGFMAIQDVPTFYLWGIACLLGFCVGGTEPFRGLSLNLLIVAFLPILYLGLSVLHKISGTWKTHPLPIGMFYVSAVLFTWLLIPVAFLGLIEPWVKLKQRISCRSS